MIKGLLLEVERIQSCCHLEKAALRHAKRARPDAPCGLVDTQFTDIVGPGDGMPLGQHHSVAAGRHCYQRWVRQLGWGLGCQRLERWGVHSPQVLKESLHHLVPMTVVVLQGHFGDLQHRAELMRAGGTEGVPHSCWESTPVPITRRHLAVSMASDKKPRCQKLLVKSLGLLLRMSHSTNK